jgi:hypothetical protein
MTTRWRALYDGIAEYEIMSEEDFQKLRQEHIDQCEHRFLARLDTFREFATLGEAKKYLLTNLCGDLDDTRMAIKDVRGFKKK